MFHTRYSLWKQVYSHRVGKAIEYMIADAFKLADPVLGISKKIDDPREFMHLDDTILNTISASKDQDLKPAQEIVKRFRKRQLYKFADEVLIPDEYWSHIEAINPADIAQYSNHAKNGKGLREENIRIHKFKINYAMKNQNPIDSVHFYSKWNMSASFSIPKERVSLLVPEKFSESYVRVFCTQPEQVAETQRCFRKLLHDVYPWAIPSRHLSLPPSPNKATNAAAASSSTQVGIQNVIQAKQHFLK
mmetsp:Transcript_20563/g.30541  ORF Transcript_20563/g.30541 Transcript_20563/m.30541 type:complete len:247 (+) Transcript_20563:3-743(+)